MSKEKKASAAKKRSLNSTFFLIERAQGGNDEAVDDLCRKYIPRLEQWATRRLPAGARGLLDTADIAQEVLLKAVGRLEKLKIEDTGAFHGYLRQAILFRIRDESRKARRRGGPALEADERIVDPGLSPLEEVLGKDGVERYEKALLNLRPQDRNAVIGRVELRLSHADLAEMLDKPSAEAARKTVSRALLRLALEIKRLGGDGGFGADTDT